VKGREFYYARFLDEDGKVIATRSTGTSNERQAVKKALEILKTIPKNPLKQNPLFVYSLLNFWNRDSEYVRLREPDGYRLSTSYIDKTRFYIENLVLKTMLMLMA
jgi:hypothetical protein